MSYDELVARLKELTDRRYWPSSQMRHEAADAITALQARVAELEEENAQYRVAKNSAGNIITQRQWNAMKQHRYTAESERDALRHDIARHVQIAAEQAQEMEKLRQDLAAARACLMELRIRLHALGRRPEECYEMSRIDAALAGEARHDK